MDMLTLILKNHRTLSPFTPQMLMAIFWEETFFTNRRQFAGGRGVGFGQVEHQNLFWLGQQRAIDFGYFVPGVNSTTTSVDDDRAVQIADCYLLHLWFDPGAAAASDAKQWVYEGYAGVRAAQGTPLSPAQRRAIIINWKACETDLLALPFTEFSIVNYAGTIQSLEDAIIAALQKAKPFDDKNPIVTRMVNGSPQQFTFRQLLFPRYWFFPPADKLALPTFVQASNYLQQGSQGTQVQFLQKLLNAQPDAPQPLLTVDGIFGSLTNAAVLDFQSQQGLATDGIVGPQTRAALA
jgi:hypothetical protein